MAGDANYGDVVLLLHCDGTNGSTTFTDTSPTPKTATVTLTGNTSISTAQSQFGGASAYFDGSGDRMTLAASSDWDLGTTYTIEFSMYPLSLPGAGNNCRIVLVGGNASYSALAVNISQTGSFGIGIPVGGTTGISTAAGVVTTDGFHYYEISVLSGVARIFKDGSMVAGPTTITTQSASSSNALYIGYDTVGTVNYNYKGYIDELRITKGVARYQGNFTPPTSAFLDYAGQVSGIVRDSSNALCARTVRAYNRSTGALVASTTSNGTTGAYTLNCASLSEVSVIALDDVAGTTENDLILRTTPA